MYPISRSYELWPTSEEAQSMFQIWKTRNESEYQEIMTFVQYMKHHRVIFTAPNCFDINKRHFSALLTNYLIAILEFNDNSQFVELTLV